MTDHLLAGEELRYVNKLKSLVTKKDNNRAYSFLLDALWRKEFFTLIPHDENRATDGIFLRRHLGFADDFGPARCLEVLIGIAKRAEFQLTGDLASMNYRDLFWEFLSNLKLNKYDDSAMSEPQAIFEVDAILNRWLERSYDRKGHGGIFPLKSPAKDQWKVELWYQMQEYVLQKEELK